MPKAFPGLLLITFTALNDKRNRTEVNKTLDFQITISGLGSEILSPAAGECSRPLHFVCAELSIRITPLKVRHIPSILKEWNEDWSHWSNVAKLRMHPSTRGHRRTGTTVATVTVLISCIKYGFKKHTYPVAELHHKQACRQTNLHNNLLLSKATKP